MRLLIHDLKDDELATIFPSQKDIFILSDNKKIRHCLGCFGCWIKTPGACVIRDDYGDIGALFSTCSEVLIISKCYYGGFSPFVKNVLDRSIPYIHPYFVNKNGEMHHKRRYTNHVTLKVLFYGDITEKEKNIARELVRANANNLWWDVTGISFSRNITEMEGQVS